MNAHDDSVPAESRISVERMQRLCDEQLPLAFHLGARIEAMEPGAASVRMPFREDFVRPGGTVSGPVLMCAADVALYAVVLSLVGEVPLAVTTQLGINFLRKPEPADVIAHGTLLKQGRRLVIGEVSLYSMTEDEDILVAHVTGTYSVPPARSTDEFP